MKTVWHLVIPVRAPLMSANDQRRAHWSKVREAKGNTEQLVAIAAHNCGLKKIVGPVSVRVVWYAPDARKRDVDSLSVFAKACLDALKKRKVIEDDNSEIVTELHLGPIIIARDNPRLEVVIRRVESDGNVPDCLS